MRKASHREAFTLIEVIVALAVGIVVAGAAGALFLSGNKQFASTTEHSSFREEALLCLERIARDMEQIVVTTGQKPDGTYHLVEPYELGKTYSQTITDPVTKQPVHYTEAGTLIRLWTYHHTEMVAGKPVVVGQKVEWETRPGAGRNSRGGVDLYRNGERVNRMTLSEIVFQREPVIIAAKQIGGSPNGILTVTVVPKGGMWGQMSRDTIERLRRDGSVVSRTFHLSGYESLYTTVLYSGLQMASRKEQPDGLIGAVLGDAELKSKDLVKSLKDGRENRGSSAYALPEDAVRIEWEKTWDPATAFEDRAWQQAKVVPGKPVPDAEELAAGLEAGTSSNGTLALASAKRR